MELAKAEELVKEALRARRLILIVGLMEVFYEGRAASTLGPGERLLIIKQDGSILVHRPSGYEPVNWQPPGSKIEVLLREDGLLIEARRPSPQEILKVLFHEVFDVYSFKLNDSAEFAMYATEEEMKKAILLEPSLIEDGFKPIEDERRVSESGFIDVFGVDSSGNLVVVEIKRRNATTEDIKQLLSYVDGIEKEFGKRPRAIIAAPGIQKSATRLLKTYGVEFRCVTPKRCHEILQRKKGLDKFLA
ncbi:MAG: endonuclease NucS [Thaumarchaeota archaeon]|nr:endonuclease NucS [Nitrososphaerota archaeon]